MRGSVIENFAKGSYQKKGSLTDQKDAKLVEISSILVDLSDKSQPWPWLYPLQVCILVAGKMRLYPVVWIGRFLLWKGDGRKCLRAPGPDFPTSMLCILVCKMLQWLILIHFVSNRPICSFFCNLWQSFLQTNSNNTTFIQKLLRWNLKIANSTNALGHNSGHLSLGLFRGFLVQNIFKLWATLTPNTTSETLRWVSSRRSWWVHCWRPAVLT